MNESIKTIQDKLMNNLERLDNAKDNIGEEVARSNAVAQLSNTYIKTCNLVIRIEESKHDIRNKISDVIDNEE